MDEAVAAAHPLEKNVVGREVKEGDVVGWNEAQVGQAALEHLVLEISPQPETQTDEQPDEQPETQHAN